MFYTFLLDSVYDCLDYASTRYEFLIRIYESYASLVYEKMSTIYLEDCDYRNCI